MSKRKGTLTGENTSVFRVAKWLVTKVGADRSLTSESLHLLTVREVYEWAQENRGLIAETLTDPDNQRSMRLSEGTDEFILGTLDCPFRFMSLMLPLWPALVFSAQPPIPKQVKEMRIVVGVLFEDGTAGQVAACTDLPPDLRQMHGIVVNSLNALAVGVIARLGPGMISKMARDEDMPEVLPSVGPHGDAVSYLGL